MKAQNRGQGSGVSRTRRVQHWQRSEAGPVGLEARQAAQHRRVQHGDVGARRRLVHHEVGGAVGGAGRADLRAAGHLPLTRHMARRTPATQCTTTFMIQKDE